MTNSKPKVSVIVPIYGVEAYIERCAVSLFEQTLDDIEYIFVNDCTPDESMKILSQVLSRYPHRTDQVVIINQPKNMGAAKAREVGIKAAKGEYIIHCDSDDWVDKDMYFLMYQEAVAHQSDMLICDWFESDGNKHHAIRQNIGHVSDFMSRVLNRSISGSLWNKLIACYIYHALDFFPTAHMMEDVAYTVQFVLKCRKISYLEKPLYYYYNNEKSICKDISNTACENRCKQACENIDLIISYLNNNKLDNKYRNEIVVLKNSARVFLWPLFMKHPRSYYKRWLSVYPEINNVYPFTSGIAMNLRIIFGLSVIGVYPFIYKIIHKKKLIDQYDLE